VCAVDLSQLVTDCGTVSDTEVGQLIKSEPCTESSPSSSPYHHPVVVSDDLVDLCPVCSDRVSGYHYGLQTCESCKGSDASYRSSSLFFLDKFSELRKLTVNRANVLF